MNRNAVSKQLIRTSLVVLLTVCLVAMGCPPPPVDPPPEAPAPLPVERPPVAPPGLDPPPPPPVEISAVDRLLGEVREGRLMPELLEEAVKDVLQGRARDVDTLKMWVEDVVVMLPAEELLAASREAQLLGDLEELLVGVLPVEDLVLLERQVSPEWRELLRSLLHVMLSQLLPWWLHWTIPFLVEILLDELLGPRVVDAVTLLPVSLVYPPIADRPVAELLGVKVLEPFPTDPLLAQLSLGKLVELLLVQSLAGQLEEPLPEDLSAAQPLLIELLLEQWEGPPR